MLVIADTSPLNYLILTRQEQVLEVLYGEVVIPHAVMDELLDGRAPALVRAFASNPPFSLRIASPSSTLVENILELGPGETAAIALAQETAADLLLIDDAAGRAEASRKGLRTVGTLGVLIAAQHLGLLELRSAVQQVRNAGLYGSDALADEVIRRGEMKGRM